MGVTLFGLTGVTPPVNNDEYGEKKFGDDVKRDGINSGD